MLVNQNKKIVIFGAGKIGRSFIGQLFSLAGYIIVFIDIYSNVIDELNARGNYNVIIKSDGIYDVINIKNVRGILFSDEQKVIEEIASSDVLAVSVGQQGLKTIFGVLANGLLKRKTDFGKWPVDLIIAENLRNAAKYFRAELAKLLPHDYPINELLGLVETSIGKMVPIMLKKDMEEDILQVFAEPYNNLILDRNGFINPIPEVEGLCPKENMKAWVDRKLFIHNLGHATAAYVGYLYNPKFIYLHEALAIHEVFNFVRGTMLQTANILLKQYPDEFTEKSLTEHIDDLLNRFKNKALGDTIYRVGCDLTRKLGPEDRLVGAVNLAKELQLPFDRILISLACACRFNARDENGNQCADDQEFNKRYRGKVERILINVSKMNELRDLQIIRIVEDITNKIDEVGLNQLL